VASKVNLCTLPCEFFSKKNIDWFQLAFQLKSFPIKKSQHNFGKVVAIPHKDFTAYVEKNIQHLSFS
jgi:hypothetical protein